MPGRGWIFRRKRMFRTKSVQAKIEPQKDGLRILAARGRGRGLPKDRYDIWMANLGPSERLRDEFLAGKIGWPEYGRRYRQELRAPGGIDRSNRRIKNHGQKFTLRLLQHLAEKVAREQNSLESCSAFGQLIATQHEPLNPAAIRDRIDNFRQVGHGHVTVKEMVGLDQDADATRALIEATAGANARFNFGQAARSQLFF
jgi:uncharacterized protein YeaO (DUF488 family)